jgi:hypothetical protein
MRRGDGIMPDEWEREFDTYAELLVALETVSLERRARVLADAGFDEELSERVHDVIDAELVDAGENVPVLVLRLDAAIARARKRRVENSTTGEPMSAERYVEAVRALGAGGDPREALGRIGLSLAELTAAAAHFNARMASDPSFARWLEARLTHRA